MLHCGLSPEVPALTVVLEMAQSSTVGQALLIDFQFQPLFQYKVLLYSLDGRLMATYRAYEWSLGVKSLAWSPSSQFLAIGSYDEKVIAFYNLTKGVWFAALAFVTGLACCFFLLFF